MNLPIAGIIFSKDRALQLDAALRSLYLHCQDIESVKLLVLYRASNQTHARQYRQLQSEYHRCVDIFFKNQGNFWLDTLEWLAGGARLPYYYRLLTGSLLPRARYVLFLVDDSLFVRPFRLFTAIQILEDQSEVLGFSLRLGTNTTYCYMLDRPQALPAFQSTGNGVLTYDWTCAGLDFGYPLEVSSSIYRTADLLPLLCRRRFRNPNDLEAKLAATTGQFLNRPRLACFETSVSFSVPVNKVNPLHPNRAGVFSPQSLDALSEKFDAGYRIDIESYTGHRASACHEEIAMNYRTSEREPCG